MRREEHGADWRKRQQRPEHEAGDGRAGGEVDAAAVIQRRSMICWGTARIAHEPGGPAEQQRAAVRGASR